MEHGKEVFRHGRILGVEETGTFQNALASFGRRMIHLFHFSGRQFTATFGLDRLRIAARSAEIWFSTNTAKKAECAA